MRKSSFVIIAFAASVALVACDDSSSASGDDVPDSSDSGAALGSSDSGSALGSSGSGDVPGSSGSVPAGMEGLPRDVLVSYSILPACGEGFHPEGSCNTITGADGVVYRFECVGTKWEYNQDCEEPMCLTVVSQMQHPECQFPECNADSEGLVHVRVTGSPRFGEGYVFYRCEQGKWVERPSWVECDTAGVTEGELCRVQTGSPGMMGYGGSWNCYKYAGKGTWNGVDCPTEPEKECTAENEGLLDSSWSNNDPKYGEMMYYRCESGSWAERGQWVTCDMEGVAKGDTCRKIEHKGSFYQYPKERVFVYEGDGAWKELPSEQPQNDFPDCSDFKDGDETLYCPTDEVCDDMKHYVCKDGTWTLAEEQK